ncbi:MAG: DUF4293 domain-containing protein [Bacteroidales bacterium]|jgi:magnesium-transporting ATPase (P-type)|nr:DUF4293 domain-containing protein [Bacteroidales bacterium]
MIQRVQTLWLVFIIIVSVASFFFPLATFSFEFKSETTVQQYGLLKPQQTIDDATQFVQVSNAWSLVFLQGGIILIALVSIFLYKNRPLQIKIVSAGVLLLAIYIAVAIFVKIDGLEKQIAQLYSQPVVSYNKISLLLPLLQLGLFMLAQRAIKKDERLVKSSDRLR